MREYCELTLNPAALHELLHSAHEFPPPEHILNGLSAEQACHTESWSPHSIATHVAHMRNWLLWCQDRLDGLAPPPLPEAENLPAVEPAQWDGLRQSFLDALAVLEGYSGAEAQAMQPLNGQNGGFMLVCHVLHNAYHLGQIVLLRRALGAWPPD